MIRALDVFLSYVLFGIAVVLGVLVAVALLIKRALGEILIISSLFAWGSGALSRAGAVHDHATWLQSVGYLS